MPQPESMWMCVATMLYHPCTASPCPVAPCLPLTFAVGLQAGRAAVVHVVIITPECISSLQ